MQTLLFNLKRDWCQKAMIAAVAVIMCAVPGELWAQQSPLASPAPQSMTEVVRPVSPTKVTASETAPPEHNTNPLRSKWEQKHAWVENLPQLTGFVGARASFIHNTDFDTADTNRFSVPFARIGLSSGKALDTLIGDITYKVDFDFGGGALDTLNLWAAVQPVPQFALKVGQFKVPVGHAVLTSTRRQDFIARPQVARMLFDYDVGLMAYGTLAKPHKISLRYAAGVWNGDGKNNFANPNEAFLYAGRLMVDLFGGTSDRTNRVVPCKKWVQISKQDNCKRNDEFVMSLGGGYAYNPSNLRGELYEQGRIDQRWTAEMHIMAYGLALHGEFMRGFIQKNNTEPGFERLSYYASVAYNPVYLPWLEVLYRYEFADNDRRQAQFTYENQSRRIQTAGLNVYFWGHNAKLQMDYVLTDLLEGVTRSPEGQPLFGDKFRMQLQVGF